MFDTTLVHNINFKRSVKNELQCTRFLSCLVIAVHFYTLTSTPTFKSSTACSTPQQMSRCTASSTASINTSFPRSSSHGKPQLQHRSTTVATTAWWLGRCDTRPCRSSSQRCQPSHWWVLGVVALELLRRDGDRVAPAGFVPRTRVRLADSHPPAPLRQLLAVSTQGKRFDQLGSMWLGEEGS